MQECSLFSKLSSAVIVCRPFVDGHSDWCEVISHCGFDLHFSNNQRCWESFHVLVSHLYVFFGEMSGSIFFPLFDRVVRFSGFELYDLLVYFGNKLLVSCFICYYFLPFWRLSFHLAYSFLCLQRLLKFWNSSKNLQRKKHSQAHYTMLASLWYQNQTKIPQKKEIIVQHHWWT